jgi:hypothetical protein
MKDMKDQVIAEGEMDEKTYEETLKKLEALDKAGDKNFLHIRDMIDKRTEA